MTPKPKRQRRRTKDWGDFYYRSLGRGEDHGYAAYYADEAMKRQARKAKTVKQETA